MSSAEPAFVAWVRESDVFEVEEIGDGFGTVLVALQDANESDVDDLRDQARRDDYIFDWSVGGEIQLSRGGRNGRRGGSS